MQAGRHLLGQLIHLRVGEIQRPPHVPQDATGGHGAEGDDLRHVVAAILAVDVVDDLVPAAIAEVHVDIRHGDTLRVQEAFKVQVVLHGVHVGDLQAIGHHGTGGRATSRPHRNILAPGVGHEVRHDEEVVHEPHPAYHLHLVPETLPVLLRGVGVALLKALLAQLREQRVSIVPLRILELRQVMLAELEGHVTAVGDALGVLDGFRPLGEQGPHLLLGFHVKLFRLKAHPVGLVHQSSHLDAHEHVLGAGILFAQVVGIVGGHQRDAGLPVDAQDAVQHYLLLLDAVVLDLQIVVPLAHQLRHLQGVLFGAFVVARQQPLGHLTGQASGQGDESLVMLLEQAHVDTGLVIEPVQVGLGDHVGQVPVAGLVLAQQHQVPVLAVQLPHLVRPVPRGNVDLTANDGVDVLGHAGFIEIHTAVHDPVVGNGHRRLSQLLHPFHQALDAAGAVQQGIFRMQMQMYKGHCVPLPLACFIRV